MTTNNEKLQMVKEQEIQERYVEFIKKYPEITEIGKRMMDEIDNSYEFHEGDEDNQEWFSFRFLGIKLTAIKPRSSVESSDMMINTFNSFIKFVETAKDYDMKVKGDNLIQRMPRHSFCIYGKLDPTKKNSRYSEYLGSIDFDTNDEQEFRNRLSDFKVMICTAVGYEPSEEEVKGLISRHSA